MSSISKAQRSGNKHSGLVDPYGEFDVIVQRDDEINLPHNRNQNATVRNISQQVFLKGDQMPNYLPQQHYLNIKDETFQNLNQTSHPFLQTDFGITKTPQKDRFAPEADLGYTYQRSPFSDSAKAKQSNFSPKYDPINDHLLRVNEPSPYHLTTGRERSPWPKGNEFTTTLNKTYNPSQTQNLTQDIRRIPTAARSNYSPLARDYLQMSPSYQTDTASYPRLQEWVEVKKNTGADVDATKVDKEEQLTDSMLDLAKSLLLETKSTLAQVRAARYHTPKKTPTKSSPFKESIDQNRLALEERLKGIPLNQNGRFDNSNSKSSPPKRPEQPWKPTAPAVPFANTNNNFAPPPPPKTPASFNPSTMPPPPPISSPMVPPPPQNLPKPNPAVNRDSQSPAQNWGAVPPPPQIPPPPPFRANNDKFLAQGQEPAIPFPGVQVDQPGKQSNSEPSAMAFASMGGTGSGVSGPSQPPAENQSSTAKTPAGIPPPPPNVRGIGAVPPPPPGPIPAPPKSAAQPSWNNPSNSGATGPSSVPPPPPPPPGLPLSRMNGGSSTSGVPPPPAGGLPQQSSTIRSTVVTTKTVTESEGPGKPYTSYTQESRLSDSGLPMHRAVEPQSISYSAYTGNPSGLTREPERGTSTFMSSNYGGTGYGNIPPPPPGASYSEYTVRRTTTTTSSSSVPQ